MSWKKLVKIRNNYASLLARTLAAAGGVWGVGLSVILLTTLRLDALPFLFLLLSVHVAVITVAIWQNIRMSWRTAMWMATGSLLLLFVYLSRFSIGIYLLPSASLTLLAGILTAANSILIIWQDNPPSETTHFQEIRTDPGLRKLTPRELEVLLLITEGKSNQEIADTLVISVNTVRHHVHQILRKLNCSSRGEAALIAKIAGLFSDNADSS